MTNATHHPRPSGTAADSSRLGFIGRLGVLLVLAFTVLAACGADETPATTADEAPVSESLCAENPDGSLPEECDDTPMIAGELCAANPDGSLPEECDDTPMIAGELCAANPDGSLPEQCDDAFIAEVDNEG